MGITNVRIFLLHLRRMKSLMRNMAFLAVMALYILSTMGYGVHRCTTDGTAQFILLFGESPCEYVHSHIDSQGNSYTHSHVPGGHHSDSDCDAHHTGECTHHHNDDGDGGCCSTDVYVVTEDQAASDRNFDLEPQMTLLASSVYVGEENSLHSSVSTGNVASLCNVMQSKEAPLAVLCTFRI